MKYSKKLREEELRAKAEEDLLAASKDTTSKKKRPAKGKKR